MYRPNLKSVDLPVAEIIAIELSVGLRTPNLGKEEAVACRGLHPSKERNW